MKVAVVTPSFNQGRFVERTLESVRGQASADYEHIIFDGGSTDGTAEMLRAYAEGDQRVRLTIGPDGGQVDAINKGLALADGDILTWLNSDDYYSDESAIAAVVAFFEANPEIDVVYGRGNRVDAEGNTLSEAFVQPEGTDFRRSLQVAIGLLQPAVFFRRRVYEAVGGLDAAYNLQLDYEYWIRIAQRGFRFGFLDRILCNATAHEDAKSTAFRMRQLDECLHLVDDRFGYVAWQWLHRYAEFHVAREDRKTAKVVLTPEQAQQTAFLEDRLLEYFYASPSRLEVVGNKRAEEPYATTWAELGKRSLESGPPRRIVITSFDPAYYEQGLNLVASLHRTSFLTVDRIYVYSLGLTPFERERLGQLEKVEVLDYPDAARAFFPEYLEPKTRAYKPAAIRSSEPHVRDGDLVLWMDAGLSALQDVREIFDRIARDGFFIADHDDRPSWPFANAVFTHPEAQAVIGATNADLLAPHLCSCIVGYRRGGKYQELIEEAYVLGQDRRAVLWPKSIAEHEKRRVRLDAGAEALRADLVAGKVAPDSVSREKLLSLFPYWGHRTQSIYSILASRYGVPVSSAKKYHRSNESSGEAAHRNWQSTALETAALSSRQNLDSVEPEVVVYHHRGTYNNLDGLRFRRKEGPLFVLGNGPSLKGFDFAALEGRAWLGMNAAYRFWDEIGQYPTYYCCFDDVVLDSHKDEVVRLIRNRQQYGIEGFFLRENILDAYPDLRQDPCVFFLEEMRKGFGFLDHELITTGSFSVLVGVVLGYRRIHILGVDLDYVEKLEEADVEGRALTISRDPEHNPNYFFDGYQRKGDRYNPPNRSAGMHLRSWQQTADILKGFPVRVTNLNEKSAVRVFPFDRFDRVIGEEGDGGDLREVEAFADRVVATYRERKYWREKTLEQISKLAGLIVGGYPRASSAALSEVRLATELILPREHKRVMIDVGAHEGSSLTPFLHEGWRIFAFEPDDRNRKALLDRLAKFPEKKRRLVTVDARAVGDTSETGVDFFRSDVSTGISGFSPFHESHQVAQQVDVVSLTEFLADRNISRVDLLKIDTEGHDRFVLQGVPWDRVAPLMVVCEFEDAKTVPLGYDWRDMADFLVAKGYGVYVSEWHPIERYGGKHDWFGLKRYPCVLETEDAWGNLVAIRDDPGGDKVAEAATAWLSPGRATVDRMPDRPAIILGNGPSLKGFDFAKLDRFDVFGMNAAYRHWYEIGWFPQYYACLDTVVGRSHKAQIGKLIENADELGIRLFLLRGELIEALGETGGSPRVVNFDEMRFASAALQARPVTTGSHTCAWASLLGYKRIYLLGVDGDYVPIVEGAEQREGIVLEIVEQKDNPNYYFAGYQQVGDKYNLPNPARDLHRKSWRAIADGIDPLRCTVINANPASRVDAFPIISFDEVERREGAGISSRATAATPATGRKAAGAGKANRSGRGPGNGRGRPGGSGKGQRPRTVKAAGGKRRQRQGRKDRGRRSPLAAFLRAMPIASVTIGIAAILAIVAIAVPGPDPESSRSGALLFVVVVAAIAATTYDYLRKGLRTRFFRLERASRRRAGKLERKVGALRKEEAKRRAHARRRQAPKKRN